MGKVYIGVTAIDGHKLWGVVGGGRLAAGDGKVAAVSYTHLTLPTTPYV